MDTNRKGAIAEMKIATAAVELGIPVLRPMAEHGRYDLAFEIAGRILRVQCKWGALDKDGSLIKVALFTRGSLPPGMCARRTPETKSTWSRSTAPRWTAATFFRVLWPATGLRSGCDSSLRRTASALALI
jgi:hypothetical protein